MKFAKKLIGNEDERAVSPVIGVILMVAITVILAAVIAAFVLDLGGSIGEEAQAGVSIDVSNSSDNMKIEASLTSMGNSEEVTIWIDGEEATTFENTGESDTWVWDDTDPGWDESAGSGFESEDDPGSSGSVTAVATTPDGTETTVTSDSYDFPDNSE